MFKNISIKTYFQTKICSSFLFVYPLGRAAETRQHCHTLLVWLGRSLRRQDSLSLVCVGVGGFT